MTRKPDPLNTQDGQYWLTQAMARRSGVSLPQEITKGRMTRGDLDLMIETCRNCTCRDACLQVLAGGETGQAPAYCLNHERIEALADGQ